MTTRQTVGPGGLRTWRPVRSSGVAFGLVLVGVAAICTVALLGADVATSSAPTRIVATVGAGIGLLVLITTAVGTWWCVSLRYALGPSALEVRWGERLLRVRYDEIEEITRVAGDETGRVPILWPGAYFGRSTTAAGETQLWRATTRAPTAAVIISTGGRSQIITPSDHDEFRELLIEHARSSPFAGTSQGPARGAWVDAISGIDGGVRGLLLAAGVVGTASIVLDVTRLGAVQRDGLIAMVVVLVNAAGALLLSIRWPIAARIIAAGAIASAAVALF